MHIRPYYKGELATLYAPNLTQQSATNRLNHGLRTNRELWGALQRSDYNTRQKLFTSYQVRLIVEFLGEP
ncbi:MAG: DUF4248 domain-containing protein [Bacteroidaceae bacterium]|nr:DUF4248 domain-containing protein [Bacteroidaceae bacterium]